MHRPQNSRFVVTDGHSYIYKENLDKIIGFAFLIINRFCFVCFVLQNWGSDPGTLAMHATAKLSHKPSGFYVF